MAAIPPVADWGGNEARPPNDSGGNPTDQDSSTAAPCVVRFSGQPPATIASLIHGLKNPSSSINLDQILQVLTTFEAQIEALKAAGHGSHGKNFEPFQMAEQEMHNHAAVDSYSGDFRTVLTNFPDLHSSPMAAMADPHQKPSKPPSETLKNLLTAGDLYSAGAGDQTPAITGPPLTLQAAATSYPAATPSTSTQNLPKTLNFPPPVGNPSSPADGDSFPVITGSPATFPAGAATLAAGTPPTLAATSYHQNPNPNLLTHFSLISQNTLNEIPQSFNPTLQTQFQTLIPQITNLENPNPQSLNHNPQSLIPISQIPISPISNPSSQFQTLNPQIKPTNFPISNPNSQLENINPQIEISPPIANPNPQSNSPPPKLDISNPLDHQIDQSNHQLDPF